MLLYEIIKICGTLVFEIFEYRIFDVELRKFKDLHFEIEILLNT